MRPTTCRREEENPDKNFFHPSMQALYLTVFLPGLHVLTGSVGDPDPHVFGPPGSGTISQRYGSGSGSIPFLIKVLSGLK